MYPSILGDNRGTRTFKKMTRYCIFCGVGPIRRFETRLGKTIAGTESFADLRFETRERRDHRRTGHNGRSCCSLPSPGSSCPSTCAYNPEAFAGARTSRHVVRDITSWDRDAISYISSYEKEIAPLPFLLRQYARSTSVGPPGRGCVCDDFRASPAIPY